jgi:hypothetical protein
VGKTIRAGGENVAKDKIKETNHVQESFKKDY